MPPVLLGPILGIISGILVLTWKVSEPLTTIVLRSATALVNLCEALVLVEARVKLIFPKLLPRRNSPIATLPLWNPQIWFVSCRELNSSNLLTGRLCRLKTSRNLRFIVLSVFITVTPTLTKPKNDYCPCLDGLHMEVLG